VAVVEALPRDERGHAGRLGADGFGRDRARQRQRGRRGGSFAGARARTRARSTQVGRSCASPDPAGQPDPGSVILCGRGRRRRLDRGSGTRARSGSAGAADHQGRSRWSAPADRRCSRARAPAGCPNKRVELCHRPVDSVAKAGGPRLNLASPARLRRVHRVGEWWSVSSLARVRRYVAPSHRAFSTLSFGSVLASQDAEDDEQDQRDDGGDEKRAEAAEAAGEEEKHRLRILQMPDRLKHDTALWATAGRRRATSIPNKGRSSRSRCSQHRRVRRSRPRHRASRERGA
jgi:hypothetical protein